jgi:mannose-6-phosphate isomerase-like protein (cupin superfamily)
MSDRADVAARHTRFEDAQPYRTKDGSLIRELMHPDRHGSRLQSLAEATLAPGATTALHRHRATEELYHILEGTARMTLGEERFDVRAGDTVCIAPGTAHCIANTGSTTLRLLCCCAPAYRHDDTDLL